MEQENDYLKDVERLEEIIKEAKTIIVRLERAAEKARTTPYDNILLSEAIDLGSKANTTRFINICNARGAMTLGGLLRESPFSLSYDRYCSKKMINQVSQHLKEKYGIAWGF